jgi:hypothetical protein
MLSYCFNSANWCCLFYACASYLISCPVSFSHYENRPSDALSSLLPAVVICCAVKMDDDKGSHACCVFFKFHFICIYQK